MHDTSNDSSASKEISAVIVAGGMGKRLNAKQPKAFISLNNKPLLLYSLSALAACPSVREVILVVPEMHMDTARRIVVSNAFPVQVLVVAGGEQRWQSVKNGCEMTSESSEWVLVHDAARPFVTTAVIQKLLEKSTQYRCVITATPVVDTIRTFDHDRCTGVIDRSKLLRVGTPQLFYRKILLDCMSCAQTMHVLPTDEAMVLEHNGIDIGFAWGDPLNFKITTMEDLILAEALLQSRLVKTVF